MVGARNKGWGWKLGMELETRVGARNKGWG